MQVDPSIPLVWLSLIAQRPPYLLDKSVDNLKFLGQQQ